MTDIRVDELTPGDKFLSPAHRWEIVSRISESSSVIAASVFTEHTGSDYAWRLANDRVVTVIRGDQLRRVPKVWVDVRSHMIMSHVGPNPDFDFTEATMLAQAFYLGRGQGWQIWDWPDGSALVNTPAPSKAKAVSLIRHAAKAHAKALGVELAPVRGVRP